MICLKCKGKMIVLWEIERSGEKIIYAKCVNCGDVDFLNGTYEVKRFKRFAERVERKVAKATRLFSELPEPMEPH